MKTLLALLLVLLTGNIQASQSSTSPHLQEASKFITKYPRFGTSVWYTYWMTAAHDSSLLISSYYERGDRTSTKDKLFRYVPRDHSLTTLIEFNDAKGEFPCGILTQGTNPDIYYGITREGGNYNLGTIYSINIKTGEHKIVYHFNTNGLQHPIFGLTRISDQEFIGICDTSRALFSAEPYERFLHNGIPYTFSLKTGSVSYFTAVKGNMNALPVKMNEDALLLYYEHESEFIFCEYSIKQRKVTSEVYVNYNFNPISEIVKGKDSCFYVMNYYTDANENTYPFLCYNALTKKCSRACKGSVYTTLYSGSFTSDDSENMYGWFKMGPGTVAHGLMFSFNPPSDTVKTFIEWPKNTDEVNEEDNEQLTPGYDFASNPVIGADGKLYTMTWDSGLVSVDLGTKKVQRLVRY